MKTEDAKALVESAINTLVERLDAGASEHLTAYLSAVARFHRYSLHNVCLIHRQRPDATRVAGFVAWRKLGRVVRRGEKGIAVLVPLVYCRREGIAATIDDPEGPVRPYGFKTGYVFDVSQTDGEPLPELTQVGGDPGVYIERLKRVAARCDITLTYANAELGTAYGASQGGRIFLRDDLSAAVEFSVLVHELAHELLHRGERRATTSKTVRETEAEAAAFVVSEAIGLDTNTAASDYIQLYAGSKETLLELLSAVQRTAAEILTELQVRDRSRLRGRSGFGVGGGAVVLLRTEHHGGWVLLQLGGRAIATRRRNRDQSTF